VPPRGFALPPVADLKRDRLKGDAFVSAHCVADVGLDADPGRQVCDTGGWDLEVLELELVGLEVHEALSGRQPLHAELHFAQTAPLRHDELAASARERLEAAAETHCNALADHCVPPVEPAARARKLVMSHH